MAENRTPAEERREVLIFAATNARADVAARVLDEEKRDPEGDVAGLLAAQPDPSKGTALHVACRLGHVDLVRLLLLRNAQAELKDGAGKTPYQVAAVEAPGGKFPAVQAAFEAELFKRCAGGDTEGAESLIAGGLDIHCEQAGYSPAAWAELFEQKATAQRMVTLAGGGSEVPAEQASAAASVCGGGPEAECQVASTEASSDIREPATSGAAGGGAAGAAAAGGPAPAWQPPKGLCLRLWPPPTSSWAWGGSAGRAAGGAPGSKDPPEPAPRGAVGAALPATPGSAVTLWLPPEVGMSDSADFVEELAEALGVAVAVSYAVAPQDAQARLAALAVPAVVPRVLGAHTRPSQASVTLAVDAAMARAEGGFRLSVLPGPAGGRVEVAGHDLAGLRAGVLALGQLLAHHGELDLGRGQLSLDGMAIEDIPPATAPSALLDVWSLSGEEMKTAFKRLQAWRYGRVLVPLLNLDAEGPSTVAPAAFRRIFEVRALCHAARLQLVPVVVARGDQPLLPAPNGDACSRAAEAGGGAAAPLAARVEVLVSLLAQFPGSPMIGFRPCSGEAAAASEEPQGGVLMARVAELQQLAQLAGVSGPRGTNVALWVPAADTELVREVCSLSRTAASFPVGGLTLMLQASAATAESPQRLTEAAAVAAAHGVGASLFAGPVRPTAPGNKGLPPAVWPGAGVKAQANALARLCSAARQAGAVGTVVEVPVYGAPWGGQGTILTGAWCSLTAFLAAGLGRSPEAGAAALGGAEDGAAAGEAAASASAAPLGELLAAQLLLREEQPERRPAQTSPAALLARGAAIASTAALALVLWEAPPPPQAAAAAGPRPPERLLQPMLALLAGRQVKRSGSTPESISAGANAWYQYLTERRRLLEELAPRVVEAAQQTLRGALCGVEWLRFACRLLLLLVKFGDRSPAENGAAGGAAGGGLQELRASIRLLPPTKGSDVRNGFLGLVERTAGLVTRPPDDEPRPPAEEARLIAIAEVLWQRGLRVGAAMDLEPWSRFEQREHSSAGVVV